MKKAHFIGIAGIGMSATAMLLREMGWDVTGSDEGFYPPVSDYLAKKHIPIMSPHKAENIPSDADLIVIGKHAKLTMENAEVRAAHERGVPIKSYPEVLGDILEDRHSVVVAGSYGKSTVAALLAWCLVHAGKDPGYMIGAIPKDLESTSSLGSSDVFIVEGDEYPSSNEDPRSKFLHYRARDVVLTSATHDHVNIFPTHEKYLTPFRELLSSLPQDGYLVVCADEPHAVDLAEATSARPITYALTSSEADYYACDIHYGEETTFSLMSRGKHIADMKAHLLGAHNVQNIVGASALLLERSLLTPLELSAAIADFHGITRRLDKKTTNSNTPVYEGFGSSHDKARSAIEAMKLHFPDRKLVVVFEPHTFSWRNRAKLDWYDTAFEGVDALFVYHPPSHGAESHDQLSLEEIVARIEHTGTTATPLTDPETGMHTVIDSLKGDEIVLLLTSGNLDGMMESIPKTLDEKYS